MHAPHDRAVTEPADALLLVRSRMEPRRFKPRLSLATTAGSAQSSRTASVPGPRTLSCGVSMGDAMPVPEAASGTAVALTVWLPLARSAAPPAAWAAAAGSDSTEMQPLAGVAPVRLLL